MLALWVDITIWAFVALTLVGGLALAVITLIGPSRVLGLPRRGRSPVWEVWPSSKIVEMHHMPLDPKATIPHIAGTKPKTCPLCLELSRQAPAEGSLAIRPPSPIGGRVGETTAAPPDRKTTS